MSHRKLSPALAHSLSLAAPLARAIARGTLLLGTLLAGCTGLARDSVVVGSQTHFLAYCDGSCELGLECVCGMCTRPCSESSECTDLASEASCVDVPSSCGSGSVQSSCSVECSNDAECQGWGEALTCSGGQCSRGSAGTAGLPEMSGGLDAEAGLGSGTSTPTSNGSDDSAQDDSAQPSQFEVEGARARARLVEYCGDCHGARAIAEGNVQGGIDYIEDFDRMETNGLVLPTDSIGSLLIQVMRARTMPPPGVQPRPSEEDIAAIAYFIDNPLFWPEEPAPYRSRIVGDRCVPADENFPDFSGFSLGEVSIESGGSCGTLGGLVCLVNQFQGRITCPSGQSGTPDDRPCSSSRGAPITVSVAAQLESRPPERAVICSCRCDGPDPCDCPIGMRCEELVSDRVDPTLAGSYCVF